jgi:hypothetical protein
MNGALFHHQDLAIALNDLGFDLPDLGVQQILPIFLAVEDFLAGLGNAFRAQRIGLAGPAKWRFGLFPRFLGGLPDHLGVNDLLRFTEFTLSKTTQAALAAYESAFSAYLIGLCIPGLLILCWRHPERCCEITLVPKKKYKRMP